MPIATVSCGKNVDIQTLIKEASPYFKQKELLERFLTQSSPLIYQSARFEPSGHINRCGRSVLDYLIFDSIKQSNDYNKDIVTLDAVNKTIQDGKYDEYSSTNFDESVIKVLKKNTKMINQLIDSLIKQNHEYYNLNSKSYATDNEGKYYVLQTFIFENAKKPESLKLGVWENILKKLKDINSELSIDEIKEIEKYLPYYTSKDNAYTLLYNSLYNEITHYLSANQKKIYEDLMSLISRVSNIRKEMFYKMYFSNSPLIGHVWKVTNEIYEKLVLCQSFNEILDFISESQTKINNLESVLDDILSIKVEHYAGKINTDKKGKLIFVYSKEILKNFNFINSPAQFFKVLEEDKTGELLQSYEEFKKEISNLANTWSE